ncbi:MAG: hypothetical protein LJE65_16110 [Desulfobacteraceae bacterium]|nr:hypothetical protein [Desulfobacteraceae bacterium]
MFGDSSQRFINDASLSLSLRQRTVSIFLLLFALLPLSCTGQEENAVPLAVRFEWNPPCTRLDLSPQITVDPVPEGTNRWYVEMVDLDLPAFDHGSGFAPAGESAVIPAGAVEGSYKGPSPPYGVVHDYQITVMARDTNNRTIGIGKYRLTYPPAGEEEIRWSPCSQAKTQ